MYVVNKSLYCNSCRGDDIMFTVYTLAKYEFASLHDNYTP